MMSSAPPKLGVVAAALSPDPRVAPMLARPAGFAGLQFDAISPALDIRDLSATGQREFLRLLSSQDQQLIGFRLDLGAKGFGPGADVDRELARLKRAMETAFAMGSPLLCVDTGPLPEPVAAPVPKPTIDPKLAGAILLPTTNEIAKPPAAAPAVPVDPAFVSQVDAALIELGRLADRTGTTIALRSDLSSLAALERALRAADCPWFGVDLDPAAVLADAWDLDETFSHLGPLIRHVRGRDAVGGHGQRTKPATIGEGQTDWAQLLSNLNESDYAGWITIDTVELPDRARAAVVALKHLRSLR